MTEQQRTLNDYELMMKRCFSIPTYTKKYPDGLTHADRCIYVGLVCNCYMTGRCYYPFAKIASMGGAVKSSVHKCLQRLMNNDLIRAEQDLYGYRGVRIQLPNDYEAGLRVREEEGIPMVIPPTPQARTTPAETFVFETARFRVSFHVEEKCQKQNTVTTMFP